MVGNVFVGYWLCQGWGNVLEKFELIYQLVLESFIFDGLIKYEDFIDVLFDWEEWYYGLDIQLFVQVLDICICCWCSEFSLNKFLGLMDWEVLCEFQ